MLKMKKLLAMSTAVLILGVSSSSAFALSDYGSPAEAVAGITGKTLEEVTQERTDTQKPYGNIAKDAGKLDEFKAEMLEIKKERLNQLVADEKITKEKADEITAKITENQANCDGTGDGAKIGQKNGLGFGKGKTHTHKGNNSQRGNGTGNGFGTL